MTSEEILREATARLIPWYREKARALSWRGITDPYRIWVSEIMLQQTRVTAVLDYYARFLAAFPSVEALAEAPEEQLMKLWEGLGYYSRARNLHKTAKQVAALGGFPTEYAQLLRLPGIGDYTASAIASAAFARREAAVDGNVLRVIARLTDCHEDVLDAGVKRRFRESLQAVMPGEDSVIRIFNQSVMELGALVCVPNGPPRCAECPVSSLCLARARGTAAQLPVKKAKKDRKTEDKTVFVLLRQGKVALRKRPAEGLLAGLWEFPHVPGHLTETQASALLSQWGLQGADWKNRLTAKHIFTHLEWRMIGYTLAVTGEGPGEFMWMDRQALAAHAVPSAFARYYAEAKARLEDPR